MQGLGWWVVSASVPFNRRRRRLWRYDDPISAEDDYYRLANRNH
jgi:hypothetical protein